LADFENFVEEHIAANSELTPESSQALSLAGGASHVR
jgi:hypothetical protein